MMFRKLTFGLLAACASIALSAPQPANAQQSFSADQRTALEAIVKEVLLKNPEIIQEALVELERRQQQAQVDAQKQVLVTERAAIFDAPKNAVAGNPQGDVTLVEFFDYNCGFCKRSLVDLQELIKGDPKLRVVLKDFPVLGADSVEASRVAIAVKNQLKGEKYWNFHVALMGVRGRVNGAKALEVAKEQGANLDQVRKDMESAETRAAIEETVVLGDRLGLTGTPAFIIADEIVFGAVGVEQIKTRIDAVRKCGRSNCG
jgi:protein-disulfide isomerase